MPEDLAHRVIHFIEGRMQFPFIERDELMGIFFIFGRNHGLYNDDVLVANDLARRTVASLTNTVLNYHASAAALDSTFIRHNYTKRTLQISLELANDPSFTYVSQAQRNNRIARDPSILTDCYTQHIAYFEQDQIFEVFQPLKDEDLPLLLRRKLQRRMILLGYNVKNKNSLPSSSTLDPFLAWLAKVDI